jgi:hypothetical protein
MKVIRVVLVKLYTLHMTNAMGVKQKVVERVGRSNLRRR